MKKHSKKDIQHGDQQKYSHRRNLSAGSLMVEEQLFDESLIQEESVNNCQPKAVTEAMRALQSKIKEQKIQFEELNVNTIKIQDKSKRKIETLIFEFKQKEISYLLQIKELEKLLEQQSTKIKELEIQINSNAEESDQKQKEKNVQYQKKLKEMKMKLKEQDENSKKDSERLQDTLKQSNQDLIDLVEEKKEMQLECSKLMNILQKIDIQKFKKLEKQNKMLQKENLELKNQNLVYQNQLSRSEINKQNLIEEMKQLQKKQIHLKKQNKKAAHMMSDVININDYLYESLRRSATPDTSSKTSKNVSFCDSTAEDQIEKIYQKLEQNNKKYRTLLDQTAQQKSAASLQSLREQIVKTANKIDSLNDKLVRLRGQQNPPGLLFDV